MRLITDNTLYRRLNKPSQKTKIGKGQNDVKALWGRGEVITTDTYNNMPKKWGGHPV